MADPSLALQDAIIAALKVAPAVCGGRIYDRPKAGAAFPYVTIGEGSTENADNSCWDASLCTVEVHVWSTKPGFPEAKDIAAEIRARLKTEFVLSGFVVSVALHTNTDFVREPDGLMSHAFMEFSYRIEHAFA